MQADVDDDPASVIRQIKAFLRNEPALTDVLFYYCGHRSFLSDRTYYLTLKATDPEYEVFTGLLMGQMRLALEEQLMRKRAFLVFDCCFAGRAAKEWMATGIGQVIEDQVLRSFPRRGLGLIVASARDRVAVAPEREPRTMFTGALLDTISSGVAGESRELSFRDIVDAVRVRISDRYGSAGVAPEIHGLRQEEGDITFTPFFVNRAFVPPRETKQEHEFFEMVIADLDRPLPRTRDAAVKALEELLLSTRSAAFREEILNKLRIVRETDDSYSQKDMR